MFGNCPVYGSLACGLIGLVFTLGCGEPEQTPSSADMPSDTTRESAVGRFNQRRQADDPSETDEDIIARLSAIGYVAGSVQAGDVIGVTHYDQEIAQPGLNLYVSGHAAEAVLMEMDGTVVHRWTKPFAEVWPGRKVDPRDHNPWFWRKVNLFPNGDLLALHEGLGLVKLDRDSNVIWARDHKVHHDLEVSPNGEIVILAREARVVQWVNPNRPVLEDFVMILGPDGNARRSLSLLEAFNNAGPAHDWKQASLQFWTDPGRRSKAYPVEDLFHTNALRILDGSHVSVAPEFSKGRILLSMCHLDGVALLDPEEPVIVWSMLRSFGMQHDPRMTDSGRMMVFENYWKESESRVLEIDVATGDVTWQYVGTDEAPFFTATCGTSRLLPNGNVLITESDNGRAFEVTREGTTVWQFLSPHRAGPTESLVATLFDLDRVPRSALPFLEEL